MSREGLDALRARVHEDPALAGCLRRLEPERFETELLRLAAECAADVTEGDLAAAVAQAKRAWMLRWVR